LKQLLAFALILMGSTYVQAHHSTAANFTQEIIEISGVIEQVKFQNPHTSLLIRVDAAEGSAPFWLVESDAKSTFERKGINTDSLAIGSKVTVSGRKGLRPNTMFLRELLMENGKHFSSSGTD